VTAEGGEGNRVGPGIVRSGVAVLVQVPVVFRGGMVGWMRASEGFSLSKYQTIRQGFHRVDFVHDGFLHYVNDEVNRTR